MTIATTIQAIKDQRLVVQNARTALETAQSAYADARGTYEFEVAKLQDMKSQLFTAIENGAP